MKKPLLITRLTGVAFSVIILFTPCNKEHSDALPAQEEELAVTYSTAAEAESEIACNDVFIM